LVHLADDLSAEKPHIVDMVLDGPLRQTRLGEVKEERREIIHELSADRKILFLAHPTLRPLRKVAAIATVWQQRGGRHWGRIEIRLHLGIDPVNSCAFPEF
jgi:hypothetical protein